MWFTSFLEHADQLHRAETSPDDGPMTPRHETRRREFSWYFQPLPDDPRRNSRCPLPPEPLDTQTPPTLEEIVGRSTTDEAESIHHATLQPFDAAASPPLPAPISRSSTISSILSRNPTRRYSITAFAKGLARRIPDMRMVPPTPGKAARSPEGQMWRDAHDVTSIKNSEQHSKPFPLLPAPAATEPRDSYASAPRPPPAVRTTPSQPSTRRSPSTTPVHGKGSLRDRRKVNLDLSLPNNILDLPVRSRLPPSALNSITPSRPRSPKTPWTNNEAPRWELSKLPKSAPIMEEDNAPITAMHESNLGPLSTHGRAISSESPVSERQYPRVRDRCYISGPHLRKTRSDRSVTCEPPLTRTPGGAWTSDDLKLGRETETYVNEELKEIGQTTKASRTRRWRWKLSSDEAPSLPSPEPPNRRYSINPFKRSARILELAGSRDNDLSPLSTRSGRDKPLHLTSTAPSSPLAYMAVPPRFVPPGVVRFPTPPVLDAEGEIKGKLANFFFDVQGSSTRSPRRKLNSSSGGHWDSDALLMSLSSDHDVEEDEEEGPEGRPPSHISSPVDFEANGTPDLKMGHSMLKRSSPGLVAPSATPRQDGWFRIQHSDSPDEYALTAQALKEEDERRKFEWLVPEHLPNSPLCPLNPIYRGPCKGMCYWHEKKKAGHRKSRRIKEELGNEWTEAVQRRGSYFDDKGNQKSRRGNRSGEAGMFDVPMQKKKRRLDSLSSP
ncbi:hypothetical protein N0V83_010323 [Neocucurbitaria cava]|uniref:Uncharacterized protein n=1 Tax=Neocucurbitaria cava TaxID=798079 RepID=A0A9W8XZF6_9PLEO|nr:hypothetical protein N0V83_010323 [Neocucurbitaria cava]